MGNYADLLSAQKHQQRTAPVHSKRTPRSVPVGQVVVTGAPHQVPAPQTAPPPTPVPQRETEQDPSPRTVERPNERTTDRTHGAPNARTAVRRRAKRYAFEFYEDQIERVNRLALEDQLRGGDLSMSDIVREAVDRYLAHLGKPNE